MSVDNLEILEAISEAFILIDENYKIISYNTKIKELVKDIKKDTILDEHIFLESNKSEALRLINNLDTKIDSNKNQNFVFNFNNNYFLLNIKEINNNKKLLLFSYFGDNYFNKVLNSSNVSIVLVDPNRINMPCIFANDSFFEKTGYTKEEIIGKNLNLLKVDNSDNEQRAKIIDSLAKSTPVSAVLKNKKKNGEIFYNKVFISPLLNENTNRLQLFLGVQSDITTQLNETFVLDSIFNTIYSIILVIRNKKLKKANNIFFETFGYKDIDDFNNKHDSFCELFIQKDTKECISTLMNGIRWAEYIRLNPNKIHKIYLKAKNNEEKVYQVSVTYSKELNEELITLNDITQLEQREEIIKRQSKFAAMGEMISMIAHQWRQPLTTLSLTFDKMHIMNKLGSLSNEIFDKNHKKVGDIIIHMSQTIDDFRTFFDNKDILKETTLKELIMVPYKLNKTILDIQKVNLKIIFNNLEDEKLNINSSRFTQVMLNLIKNSLDEFANIDSLDKNIQIKCSKNDKYYIIEFLDNAGGIPEDIIDNIFDPYFSTKSKNGTGIGLYMTKIIIEEQINGTIEVKNSANGALFTISIPLERGINFD